MAGNLGTLAVYLTAHTTPAFKREIYNAERTVNQFSSRIERLSRYGLAGLGGALAFSAREFMNFDTEMTKSVAIMKGVTADMRSELERTAVSISTQYKFSASQLAQGYFYLFSAGKSLSASQKELVDVARFAQAGQFDLATATTLLADAQKALGLSSENLVEDQKQLVRVSDVLVRANTLANANVQQFSEALTNEAAAAMRAFNIRLEEGVAVLAAYAEQGTKGQEAGSMLGRFLRLLVPAANENEEAFSNLNIRVFDAQGNLRNLAYIIYDMERAFSTMSVSERSAALEALGFEKKMQGAVFPLLGMSRAIYDYENQLILAGGTTQEVADNQLKTLSQQFGLLINNVQATVSEAMNFSEVIGSAGEAIGSFTQLIRDTDRPTKALVINLTAATAAIAALALAAKGLGILKLAKAFIVLSVAVNTHTVSLWKDIAATAAANNVGILNAIMIKSRIALLGKLAVATNVATVATKALAGALSILLLGIPVAIVGFSFGKWVGELDVVKNRLQWISDLLVMLSGEQKRSEELDRKIAEFKKQREALIAAGKINPKADVERAERAARGRELAEKTAEIETKNQKELAKLEDKRRAAMDKLLESRMTQEDRINQLIKERDKLEAEFNAKGISKQERLRRETELLKKQYELEQAQKLDDKKGEKERLKQQREMEKQAKTKSEQRVQESLVRGTMEAVKAEAQSRIDAQGIELSRQIVKNTERTARAAEKTAETIKNYPGTRANPFELIEAI